MAAAATVADSPVAEVQLPKEFEWLDDDVARSENRNGLRLVD